MRCTKVTSSVFINIDCPLYSTKTNIMLFHTAWSILQCTLLLLDMEGQFLDWAVSRGWRYNHSVEIDWEFSQSYYLQYVASYLSWFEYCLKQCRHGNQPIASTITRTHWRPPLNFLIWVCFLYATHALRTVALNDLFHIYNANKILIFLLLCIFICS